MFDVVLPVNWLGRGRFRRIAKEPAKPVSAPIEIYVRGDPREREEKKWAANAKIAAAILVGLIGGYLWAALQGAQ